MVLSCTEAATRGVPLKKLFLEIPQNSQENTRARVSFLIKLQSTLLKKRLWHRWFPVNFVKFRRTPFLQNTSGRPLLHLTCFAKVSLFLLKSSNIKVTITFRFIIEKLTHIKWDFILPSSLRLLLKVWIWFRFQNRKFLSPAWWRIISF